jgi:hypothetical protein
VLGEALLKGSVAEADTAIARFDARETKAENVRVASVHESGRCWWLGGKTLKLQRRDVHERTGAKGQERMSGRWRHRETPFETRSPNATEARKPRRVSTRIGMQYSRSENGLRKDRSPEGAAD